MSLGVLVLAHAGHLLVDLPIFLGPIVMVAGVLLVLNLRGRGPGGCAPAKEHDTKGELGPCPRADRSR